MKKLTTSLFALLAVLMMFTMLTPPADAGVTFVTRGQAKVGGLILGSTTITPTGTEVNTLADEIATATQTTTAATGSNAAQFVFKNAAGVAVSSAKGLVMYISTSAGTPTTAVTSVATLTNGTVATLVTGSVALAHTTASGLLGVTTTASTGSYYLSFVLPNGKIITSTVLTVN